VYGGRNRGPGVGCHDEKESTQSRTYGKYEQELLHSSIGNSDVTKRYPKGDWKSVVHVMITKTNFSTLFTTFWLCKVNVL